MLHITHTKTIYKYIVSRNFFIKYFDTRFGKFHNCPIVWHHNFTRIKTIFNREVTCFFQKEMVGIHWHVIIWFHLVEHVHNIFASRMTRHVHVHNITVNDIVTLTINIIFETLNTTFVARNNRRRKNNRISFHETNFSVVTIDNTHQDRIFFTLRTSTYHYHIRLRIIINLFHINKYAGRGFDITKLLRYFDIHFHTKSIQRDFFAKFLGCINNPLHTFYL